MPANMREISGKKFITAPNKDSYVFIQVKNDAPSVIVSDGTGEYVLFSIQYSNFLVLVLNCCIYF